MADDKGWFYRSLNDLCIDSGIDKKTLILAKKQLIEYNYIEVRRSFYKNTHKRSYDYYQINGFKFRYEEDV